MTQSKINLLLKSFNISKSELDSRAVLEDFADSLSSVIVEDFAQNYLLNNPELSIYLAHTDAPRLLKNIKEFVSFVLTAPVDEAYITRIYYIGSIHFSIKLEPAKISYGFWAINEILNKLSNVNELVKEHKSLISKVFRFVEHTMHEGYYIHKNKLYEESIQKLQGFNAQNELYMAFQLHKQNMQKINLAVKENGYLGELDEITQEASSCEFSKILQKLKSDKKYEYILGIDVQMIASLHSRWHREFIEFRKAIERGDEKDIEGYKNSISATTDELKEVLDASLESSLEDGHVALNSGIKAMKNMTKLFHVKDNYSDFKEMLNIKLKDTFSEFHWAIDDIYLNFKLPADESYSVRKTLRHNTLNIYIGIKIQKSQNNKYMFEMFNILLEVLDIHLSAKERESSLVDFANKAENANKSKDIFLANMSHELRTPLNAITGFSQIIMMKKDTPEGIKEYVKKINTAGNNLLDIVNTILDFAKLEAGKIQFSPKLNNISKILSEVVTIMLPLALKKEINLKMPNIISLNLYIDDKLFKQVLINLLTNAIKFTPNGGNVSLNIVYNVDKRVYQFEVKDDGIGISQESISKLFQPFAQVENSYHKQEQGTGLGLMISKKIVEDLHNGKIWVESKEGEGSSFYLNMPTPMIESHTYSIFKAGADAKEALIVEDSPDYQKILAENLSKDINLTFTDTINKAKSLLAKTSYNFLILDFFLTDGISSEILEFMEDEHISIPTVVISAEDEIIISSSLSGSSNLEGIINKKNIDDICASIRGESYIKS